ncbi:MAG: nucleoside monophosphate kinase [Patescibacteria group bacterium]|nr:nucleoside monophosphate kinase [Patescibacteria group bacterium]
MKFKDFPIELVKTKAEGVEEKFDLSNVAERKKYFEAKAGKEIEDLKKYLDKNTFVAYWLGKKNSGKGTYSKMMMEVFGENRVGHISVGDVIREAHSLISDEKEKKLILDYLNKHYRGYISLDEAIDNLLGRSTAQLIPTEFTMALIKRVIDKMGKKTIFLDGFPRDLDQISYALFFRNLIDYRDDMDIFIAIDIPETIIDERMRNRVVCPKCQTPRSLKLLATDKVGYDKTKKEFYLICDDPKCGGARMVAKEGDNLGIEAIRDRLELDQKLIEKVFSLHGVPKILLRNAIPVSEADKLVDNYEITPEFYYELENGKVIKKEKPWTVKDDEGIESVSLIAPPVVLSLIKQLHRLLILLIEK